MERSILTKLRPQGLLAINSFFDCSPGDKSRSQSIHFAAPRISATAAHLQQQINILACKNLCPFNTKRGQVVCTGVNVDIFTQVVASLSSSEPQNKEEWRQVLSQANCEPTLK